MDLQKWRHHQSTRRQLRFLEWKIVGTLPYVRLDYFYIFSTPGPSLITSAFVLPLERCLPNCFFVGLGFSIVLVRRDFLWQNVRPFDVPQIEAQLPHRYGRKVLKSMLVHSVRQSPSSKFDLCNIRT